jgi:hypothetical protein
VAGFLGLQVDKLRPVLLDQDVFGEPQAAPDGVPARGARAGFEPLERGSQGDRLDGDVGQRAVV